MSEGNAGGASGGDGGSSSKAGPSKAGKPKSRGKDGAVPKATPPGQARRSAGPCWTRCWARWRA